MDEINQRRLRYFYEVSSCGKICHAADNLNTDASVITRQIKLLEDEIGTKLLERRPRGCILTKAGQLLLEYYHHTRNAREDLELNLQELRDIQRGNINIATFASYIDVLMEEVIDDFHHKHPSCAIRIQEIGSTPHIIAKVLDDEVHIGIIHGHYPDHPDLYCYADAPLPLHMLVNKTHPLASKRKGILADIVPYPLVQPPFHYSVSKIVQSVELLEKIQFVPAFVSDSIAARKRAAVAGHGGVLMSSFAARHEIKANQLVPFEIDHPAFTSMKACLIVRRGRPLTPAVTKLLRLISAKLSIFQQNPSSLNSPENTAFSCV